MREKKILILGSANVNPINILCKNLRDFGTNKYILDGLNLDKIIVDSNIPQYEYLDGQFEISPLSSIKGLRPSIIFKTFKKIGTKNVIRTIIAKRLKIKHAKNALVSLLIQEHYYNQIISKILEYETVNIQYLRAWQAKIIPLIPKNIRVVISIWGSDLMATAGKDIYSLQYDAFQRADAITVVSGELEEILLSKFGRNLKAKVYNTLYGLSQDTMNHLILNRDRLIDIGERIIKKREFDKRNFKYIIKVGYNASENQNHIIILEKLGEISSALKKSILLIIPMTYGHCQTGYKNKVEKYMLDTELNGIVLNDYLSSEEALSISSISNIMINAPRNDAFNNSMSESITAGAIVLNGGWLPYKMLKAKGVFTLDFFSFDELPNLIENITSNFSNYISLAKSNNTKMHGYISGRKNVSVWERALTEKN